MFTGSDYRAIPGNQLLNQAGQTASALGGEESECARAAWVTGRLWGGRGGVQGQS